jgi:argininosuccinate lyase
MLAAGELNGVSSIMPQKRNPAALEQLRAQASILLGEMHTVALISHNNRTGMFDYRAYDPVPSARALQVFRLLQQVVDGIVVDKARARAEVDADYATTTEIADALAQKADVPFRIGHHFASRLTDYGRGKGLKIGEIPYAEAVRIYEVDTGARLPLAETEFGEAISADYMVFGRRGVGGPQPEEVKRMLTEERARIAADRNWLEERNEQLACALAGLDRAFGALADAASA